jgi:DNA-(apurinic or apyrimidinic site) lyase
MERPRDSKTLTFTIKMFGYGARIIFKKIVYYPIDINIPIDSRLKKIYEINTNQKPSNNIKQKKMIAKYFANLSNQYKIPPLHLDSILWIDYRKKYIKK